MLLGECSEGIRLAARVSDGACACRGGLGEACEGLRTVVASPAPRLAAAAAPPSRGGPGSEDGGAWMRSLRGAAPPGAEGSRPPDVAGASAGRQPSAAALQLLSGRCDVGRRGEERARELARLGRASAAWPQFLCRAGLVRRRPASSAACATQPRS